MAKEPIKLPLIRKTFPQLFANEIVGVQPMGNSTGLAYSKRFVSIEPVNEGSEIIEIIGEQNE